MGGKKESKTLSLKSKRYSLLDYPRAEAFLYK